MGRVNQKHAGVRLDVATGPPVNQVADGLRQTLVPAA